MKDISGRIHRNYGFERKVYYPSTEIIIYRSQLFSSLGISFRTLSRFEEISMQNMYYIMVTDND